MGAIGLTLERLWPYWGSLGALGSIWAPFSEQMLLKYRACAQNLASRYSPGLRPEMGHQLQLGTSLPHLAVIWVPLGPFGLPWGLFGLLGCSGLNLGSIFRGNVAQVPRLRTKSSRPLFARFARVARFIRGNGVWNCCSDPTFTRAGGQDDVSYTNSLKLGNIWVLFSPPTPS